MHFYNLSWRKSQFQSSYYLDENSSKKQSVVEISADQLKTLFNSPIVHNFILEADYALYQYLVDILLPKVLKPIPNTLTQWIRTFSKEDKQKEWVSTLLTQLHHP